MSGISQERPLISVITACRNAARTLEQCIKSVHAQTFDDYEFLVLDGGSNDESCEIIRKHAAGINYWQSQPDRGIADAWNQGIARSHGEWLLFLNADDYLCNSKVLSRMAGAIAERPNDDVVYGQIRLIGREGEGGVSEKIIGGPFVWRRFVIMDTIPHPASFTSRHYFERVGEFSEAYSIAADYEIFLRAGRNLRARFVPVQVSCMRDGGLSRTDVRGALWESAEAKIRNNVLSFPLARLLFAYLLCRTSLKRVAMGVLGKS